MNSEDDEFARIEREINMRQVPLPAKIYDYEEAYFALKAKRALAVPDPIHHTDTRESLEYITGWNDCRAAMLAEQPAQQCKWPTCQSEEAQQALAEQIKRELVGEQPAQRTWVGLTDEDVRQCSQDVVAGGAANSVDRFAYAIEAKLKEKNT